MRHGNAIIADFIMEVDRDAEFRRQQFRQPLDPFELPDHQFVQIYRLKKDMVDNVVNRMEDFLPQKRVGSIDLSTKVNL